MKVDFKEQFMETYREHIRREGADRLLAWLEKSDFFAAPASTRFHGSHAGGLCRHSLGVHERLTQLVEDERISPETMAICGLLHDLCKVDFYRESTRNVKNEKTGQWEKQPFYLVEDSLPYGHGEKSVYIISGFMKLSREEAMAIRWHMGGFDEAVRGGSLALSGAWERYPLGVLLHAADLLATYIDEEREERK